MTTVSSSTAAGGQSDSQAAQTGLTANYELFLSILTTQIQNQDPLDPMDSAEYTSQLVQYTNVEQTIQTNRNLEDMLALLKSNESMSYVSYIGNEITADASRVVYTGGVASWNVEISEDATGPYVIRNSSGDVVYEGETSLKQGTSSFEWNGRTNENAQVPAGVYSVHFDLKDSRQAPERVSTVTKGIVDSVDWSSGQAVLSVGGRDIPVSDVQSVSRPS